MVRTLEFQSGRNFGTNTSKEWTSVTTWTDESDSEFEEFENGRNFERNTGIYRKN